MSFSLSLEGSRALCAFGFLWSSKGTSRYDKVHNFWPLSSYCKVLKEMGESPFLFKLLGWLYKNLDVLVFLTSSWDDIIGVLGLTGLSLLYKSPPSQTWAMFPDSTCILGGAQFLMMWSGRTGHSLDHLFWWSNSTNESPNPFISKYALNLDPHEPFPCEIRPK